MTETDYSDERLAALVDYTPEGQALIASLDCGTNVELFGFRLALGEVRRFTTKEGLKEQIAAFPEPCGLIYFMAVNGGRLEMRNAVWMKPEG